MAQVDSTAAAAVASLGAEKSLVPIFQSKKSIALSRRAGREERRGVTRRRKEDDKEEKEG